MISQSEGIQLIESEFPQLTRLYKKRIKFSMPGDFYNLFLTRIEKSVTPQSQVQPVKELGTRDIIFRLATKEDRVFARQITDEMQSSTINRGCGISKRSPLSVIRKMIEGKAIIAVTPQNEWVGFSYIETYENNEFVSNSGLIVAPACRQCGVAKAIKQRVFDLSRTLYPNAKIFSITTGAAVMKMNSRLGFEPVTYGEITREKKFWEGCKSCVNYQTLLSKDCKNCFCTAMLYTPDQEEPQEEENECETEHHH